MPRASLLFNPDGTTRVTLVQDETLDPVEGFEWAVNAFRNEAGYAVQVEALDGSHAETVTVVGPDDLVGARDQALVALINKAREAGHVVTGAVIPNEQEPLP
jgi:hypothetical protein